MRSRCLLTSAGVVAVVLLTAAVSFAQGPMTPPSGAFGTNGVPISHMKTLNQVEPRFLIPSLPWSITNPGSYFIVENLSGPSDGHGISIMASDVKLDLNGFALLGDKEKGGTDGAAIWIEVDRYNVTVRNGVTRNWLQGGLCAYGTYDGRAERLIGYSNGGGGCSDIYVAKEWTVVDCISYSSGSNGITAYAACVIKDSMAFNAKVAGIYGQRQCRIRECLVYGNDVAGIRAGQGCTVRDCTVSENDNDGILVESNNRIQENNCVDNGGGGVGAGIHVVGNGNRIEDNAVNGNQYGIQLEGENNFTVKNTEVGSVIKGYELGQNNRTGAILLGAEMPEEFSSNNTWANFDM